MRETESLCAENIGLKDIARSRRRELVSRGKLIMYYRPREHFYISSTSIPCRNAYKILSRLKKPLPEVYARSVGKFVQLHLL